MAEVALVTVAVAAEAVEALAEAVEALAGAEVEAEALGAVDEEEEEEEEVEEVMEGAFPGLGERGGKHRGVSLSLRLCLVGGGFQSGGSRGRGRGGRRGNQSGKNVMVEPHRHEGE